MLVSSWITPLAVLASPALVGLKAGIRGVAYVGELALLGVPFVED